MALPEKFRWHVDKKIGGMSPIPASQCALHSARHARQVVARVRVVLILRAWVGAGVHVPLDYGMCAQGSQIQMWGPVFLHYSSNNTQKIHYSDRFLFSNVHKPGSRVFFTHADGTRCKFASQSQIEW